MRYVPHDLSHIQIVLIAIYRERIIVMNTKKAVAERIIQLCEERNIAINALANISGVAPSTVYSMLNEKSQNPGIVTIKKLCDGLEIGLREFFASEMFDGLEQDIK